MEVRHLVIGVASWLACQPFSECATNETPGDRVFADYFRRATRELQEQCLAEVHSSADWTARKTEWRRQLSEMLGLDPFPTRDELHATVTGRLEDEAFTVEKLHFQSLPGLYVTANLYLPKGVTAPAPAILYVCGHSVVKTNGISYGNKSGYQHHAVWFARHGYVCLVLDTLQLGEIEGIHHGTHREGRWWWNARGYTPAGVEAWNGIRALDYLQTRPEVDGSRMGMTGRSGGGAYTWWVAALDDRVKVAAPVAGLTDLEDHVVGGTVEGHCDCMFHVNTYQWDFPQVAALLAPRPLLIANTDKDRIFPLDGVLRAHAQVRRIYALLGASNQLGLLITAGPHKDTQDLQVPVFRWFDRFLKDSQLPVADVAERRFTPQELKVLAELPAGSRNAKIDETFVPAAGQNQPSSRETALRLLEDKCFRAWPASPAPLDLHEAFAVTREGMVISAHDFLSEPGIELRLYVARPAATRPARIRFAVLDQPAFIDGLGLAAPTFGTQFARELELARSQSELPPGRPSEELDRRLRELRDAKEASVTVAPRGVGLTVLRKDPRYQTHVRRRFMLLGQTLDSARVWDIRRALAAARLLPEFGQAPITAGASGPMAANLLIASLFEDSTSCLDLHSFPERDEDAPDYLNFRRVLTWAQAIELARQRCEVRLLDETVLFGTP